MSDNGILHIGGGTRSHRVHSKRTTRKVSRGQTGGAGFKNPFGGKPRELTDAEKAGAARVQAAAAEKKSQDLVLSEDNKVTNSVAALFARYIALVSNVKNHGNQKLDDELLNIVIALSTCNNGTFFTTLSGRNILSYIVGIKHPKAFYHLNVAIVTFEGTANKEKKCRNEWVNYRDVNGDTVLIIACRNNEDPRCALLLLEKYKDVIEVGTKNGNNLSAVDFAIKHLVESTNPTPEMGILVETLLDRASASAPTSSIATAAPAQAQAQASALAPSQQEDDVSFSVSNPMQQGQPKPPSTGSKAVNSLKRATTTYKSKLPTGRGRSASG